MTTHSIDQKHRHVGRKHRSAGQNHRPKISIGVPVYNGETYLRQTLDSLLAQSFTDFEIIISDNASTDHTRQICKEYAARDARIHYIRVEKNMGAAWNFNQVFRLSNAEYFHWQSHDDLLHPEFLARAVEVLDQHPQYILCSSLVDVIDQSGNLLEHYPVRLKTAAPLARRRFRTLLMDYHLCYDIFGLIRSSALRQTPLIGNFGHGDGILLERLGLLGPFYQIPEILFYARVHPRQSMKVYGALGQKENNYHQYTVWFDPSKSGRIILPNWRILVEHLNSLTSVPLSFFDLLYCLYFILYWAGRRRHALLQDVLIALHQILARTLTRKNHGKFDLSNAPVASMTRRSTATQDAHR